MFEYQDAYLNRFEEAERDRLVDEIYREKEEMAESKDAIISILKKTLAYYADASVYHKLQDSIFIDQGQRARMALNTVDELEEYDCDERAHHGFCDDIKLPADFKFIEMQEGE